MRKTVPILGLLLFWLALPSTSVALGLGDIQLESYLNQPFRAEIPLEGVSPDELMGLSVKLASRDAFERLGLDRPFFLDDFRFQVERKPDGSAVVRVSSARSVTEPFVTMLVEAVWPRGRLLREYTVFLDPPSFVQAAPSAPPAPVQEATRGGAETRSSGTVLRQQAVPTERQEVPPAGAPYDAPPDGYRVQRNDTLSEIAMRYRPDASISMNQMMIALFEANPNAFMGRNINLLRAGSILRIPDRAALEAIGKAAAAEQVAQHHEQWRSGAAATAPSEPVTARLELRPPAEEAAAGTGLPVTTAEELVGDAEGTRGEIQALREQVADAERRLALKDDELAALQARLAELEAAQAAAMPGLAEPETGEPEALEPPLGAPGEPIAETGVLEETVEAEPGLAEPEVGEAAPEIETAEPEVPVVVTPARPAEPTLVEKILGWVTNSFVLIGLGVLLIAGAALAFLRRRRAEAGAAAEPWEQYEEVEDTSPTIQTQTLTELPPRDKSRESFLVEEDLAPEDTASIEALSMDEEEEELRMTGTHGDLDSLAFTGTGTEPPITETMAARALDLGEGDPLAEADFHMAYGLYDQAADVIRGAMEREPRRRDLLAKLAEINFVWGNRDQFIDCARRLFDTRDQGSDSEWDKILIMGKQIAPEEPLFSGEPQAAADEAVDLALEATAVAAPMDLHLGDDESRGVDLDFSQALDTSGDTRETPALKQKQGSAAADDSLDFDFTGDTQETPTLETPAAEAPTVETPTIESRAAESPTVETPTVEMPAGEEPGAGRVRADDTAELELDDLGLDVSLDDSYLGPLDRTGSARALEEAAEGLGDEEATAIRKVDFPLGNAAEEEERADRHADTETLAATDLAISEELGDDDATMLASTLKMPEGGIDIDSTSSMRADVEEGIDLDLSEFSAEELYGGDTAEQPGIGRHTDADITGMFERTAEHEALDLDVGDSLRGAAGDQTATESVPPEDMTVPEAEAVTMSEIGTKLDLARAYMDMGDPDGARSILQEVMEEGDDGQRADAQRLMESLP